MDGGVFAPGGSGARFGTIAVILAGVCALVATLLSVISIWLQFKNYRKPLLQRYVVRILLMVPIYSISSWVALMSLTASFFVDPIRDVYEAFTIYTFFQLLINFLGGERSLLILTYGREPIEHLWPVNLILPKLDISDPHTFLNLKRGILQYAWLKPILGLMGIVMKACGVYKEGYLEITSGYLWSGIAYNISVTVSLYSLGMFWACMNKDLQPFRPMPKFLCIKLIIFASYWQGFMLSILVWLGWIPDVRHYTPDNLARAIQDALICYELPAFAIAHWYAFSWKDYADKSISAARMPVLFAFRDAFGIRDLVEDAKLTFAGKGYEYRNFDSVGETTMVHAESAGRLARMQDGMRYERGGKGKYWIPKPAVGGTRSALKAKVQQVGGTAACIPDGPARRVVEESLPQGYGTIDPDIRHLEIDETDEKYYKDARKMEFGDYNYPVITAYEPVGDHHCSAPDLITTATNQKYLRPELSKARKSSSKSSSSRSSKRDLKGKGKAIENGDQEEHTGLLSSIADTLHLNRSDSSSSHFSQRSGIVDLVVEDTEAEEIERVRARKEGAPGWNDAEAKRYVIKYGEREGEQIREGLSPEEDATTKGASHALVDEEMNAEAHVDGEHFVVAEDDEEEEEDSKVNYGGAVDHDNPWK